MKNTASARLSFNGCAALCAPGALLTLREELSANVTQLGRDHPRVISLCNEIGSLLDSQVLYAASESIDRPFIVLTETKSSYRHIPVWARYSPHCMDPACPSPNVSRGGNRVQRIVD